MDKNSTIGMLLILFVTMIFLMFVPQPELENQPGAIRDSLQTAPTEVEPGNDIPQPDNTIIAKDTSSQPDETPLKNVFNGLQSDSTIKTIHIENSVLKATISNVKGGSFIEWKLKEYDYHFDDSLMTGNVNLAAGNEALLKKTDFRNLLTNGIDIEVFNKNGKKIQLRDYVLFTETLDKSSYLLDESNPTQKIEFYLPVENGRIVTEYTFHHDKYGFDLNLRFENLQNYFGSKWYSINWENGLRATEENAVEDYTYALANVYLDGDELETLDITEDGREESSPSGNTIDWTAIRTKYFTVAMIPHDLSRTENVNLVGEATTISEVLVKNYTASLSRKLPGQLPATYEDNFTFYMGPLDVTPLSTYNVGLDDLVLNTSGYESFFRLFTISLVLPSFKFLHNFIPNYGLVIILFAVLIKLLLYPLTKKSYESMGRMQELQPMMKEIQEKYKSDPQRQQKELMKFYKENKFNPAGGCIPMLLQMPLLIALFIVFRSTIQLRGEPFFAWITDLSKPDVLMNLGFSIPFLGDALCILPFFMGITMIFQSKSTMTDPKQKALIYIMPVALIFIFYSFPSGLNLYYAVFNILSAIQTKMIKKNMPKTPIKKPAAANPGRANGKPAARPQRSQAQRKKKKKR